MKKLILLIFLFSFFLFQCTKEPPVMFDTVELILRYDLPNSYFDNKHATIHYQLESFDGVIWKDPNYPDQFGNELDTIILHPVDNKINYSFQLKYWDWNLNGFVERVQEGVMEVFEYSTIIDFNEAYFDVCLCLYK